MSKNQRLNGYLCNILICIAHKKTFLLAFTIVYLYYGNKQKLECLFVSTIEQNEMIMITGKCLNEMFCWILENASSKSTSFGIIILRDCMFDIFMKRTIEQSQNEWNQFQSNTVMAKRKRAREQEQDMNCTNNVYVFPSYTNFFITVKSLGYTCTLYNVYIPQQ